MRVVIVRREPGIALSMDVYADHLIAELKMLRPEWEIVEIAPDFWNKNQENLWQSGTGLRKYYERLWRHPRAVSQLQADIFHIIDHSNAHVAYWLKRENAAIVVTCHDLVQFVYPEILKDQSRFPALSMASWKYSVRGMSEADRIIAVSENTAKDVSKMLAIEPQRVTVVPNGVDAQFYPLPFEPLEQVKQQYGYSPETICLLNIGSTHQRKNIFTILKVLATLRDQNLPVCLWKAGDDFTTEQKLFIQAQQLEPFILNLGKPDQTTLIALYSAADVLLAPSLYEGFGLTVLEAMACGTPVITSNVSSLPEVTGDAAVLVEPMDVKSIATAVYQLKQDAVYRATLVERGLARAKLFTWKRAAEQVASVYEQLAQHTESSRSSKLV
jgi:glycosyltransferase involved in cell wall biosynthesis